MNDKTADNKTASSFFDQHRSGPIKAESESPATLGSPDPVDRLQQHPPVESVNDAALPSEAKRALVSLMRHGTIVAKQKPQLFEQVCRYQHRIQQQLANMYLRLLLDEKSGYALVLQQEQSGDGGDEDEIYTLINRRTLSLYDTLLLLVLRKYYQEREAAGEQHVVIDLEHIEANLTPFIPLTNSSKSDRAKLNAALAKMSDRKVLSSVRGEDARYEITPIIRYVVNAEFLERLLNEYTQLAQEQGLLQEGLVHEDRNE